MMRRLLRRPLGLALLLLGIVALGATVTALRDRLVAGPAKAEASATAPDIRTGIVLDERRQQLIGVRTARVSRGSLTRTIRGTGAVAYDETRLMDVNLKVEGWIRDVHASYVGQRVKRGEPLVAVYSPELDAVQSNLLTALRGREQSASGLAADTSYADRVVDAPRRRLLQWGVSEQEVRALEQTGRIPPAVVFRSPMDGVVVEKAVMKGSHVQPGQTLYKIADLSVVWIEADFHESDVNLLKEGARTDVRLVAYPGERFTGRILNTHPFLSGQTRTITTRIELQNPARRLKPGMSASVEIATNTTEGLLVPTDAVLDSGSRQIVFVAQGDGHFEPRAVTVGARADDRALILSGLTENEQIATRATFFLDSESQIRTALQNYSPAPSAPRPSPSVQGVELSLQFTPNPPRAGENVIHVRVQDPEGRPMTDAQLQVRLQMPPMPAMNMPAMRSEARLMHLADGVYSGSAVIQMAGRWDVTVTALREGRLVASKHTTLIAR